MFLVPRCHSRITLPIIYLVSLDSCLCLHRMQDAQCFLKCVSWLRLDCAALSSFTVSWSLTFCRICAFQIFGKSLNKVLQVPQIPLSHSHSLLPPANEVLQGSRRAISRQAMIVYFQDIMRLRHIVQSDELKQVCSTHLQGSAL